MITDDWANMKALELVGAAVVAIPMRKPKLLEEAAEKALKAAHLAAFKEALDIVNAHDAERWRDPEVAEVVRDSIAEAISARISILEKGTE